jgi:hypothetical protein
MLRSGVSLYYPVALAVALLWAVRRRYYRGDPGVSVMKKLLLATVCVVALTVGAQAKPVQQALIDNSWVIAYDSELVAGACIATMNYNLLKLKISFITAYPTEGAEKLWFVGLSSPEWFWIKSGTTYDFAIDTKRTSGETQGNCHPQSVAKSRTSSISWN